MQDKILDIKERIRKSAEKVGRNPDEITLVAVSKRHLPEKIIEAAKYGLTEFGENYAQELRDKAKLISEPINWHFIGPIQENKIKYLVGTAKLIHTVSSPKILNAIQKKAEKLGIIQEVLVQIKTGDEANKSGLLPNEVFDFLGNFQDTPNVKCIGIMMIPPFDPNPENTRKYFVEMKNIFDEINAIFDFNLTHISMGMSGDFEIAIEEGATIVRIGTAIFGQRPPK